MKRKILFINPGYSLKDLYGDLAESGNELPPQTLAGLAATTRQYGYDTAITDCAAMKMDMPALLRSVSSFSPDYIGITATTITMENAGFVATEIKKSFPDVKVIAGGAHITALPEETLERFPAIDVGVIGEGEETIIQLLSCIDSNGLIADVTGIAFRGINGKIVITSRREVMSDIDVLPLPAWDLLPPIDKFYRPPGDSINRMPAIGMVTSRGCPGRCIFCDKITFGRKFRPHSASYVLALVKDLVDRYGVKEIYFQDDYFMASKKRLIEICNGLIEADYDLTWTCTGRISSSIDADLLHLMKRAGCWQICYGVESGSQKILDIIQKDTRLDDIRECIAKTRRAGLSVKGFFMLGNFLETEGTVKETMNFIRELPLTDFHMCYFVPFPGSPAYHIAEQYGRFDKTWKKMNLYSPKSFIPHGLTEERMKEFFRKCYRAHYLKPEVILYFAKKIKNMHVFRKLIASLIAFIRFSFVSK